MARWPRGAWEGRGHRRRHRGRLRRLHLARAGANDVLLARQGRADQRLDAPRRGPGHPAAHVPDDDGLPPPQHRALPRARRLRAGRAACASPRARRAWSSCAARSAARRPSGWRLSSCGPAEVARAHAPGGGRRSDVRRRSGCRATATSTRTSRPTRWPTRRARLGVTIRTGARVTAIELGAARDVRAVRLGEERIETEAVVDAAGIWAPQVAAMAGAFLPLGAGRPPARRDRRRCPGHEVPRDAPCFRDPDNLVYGRAEAGGGLLVGGYEPDPVGAVGGRRALGSRREPGPVGHGPLRAAARGRDPPLPVPRGRGRDPPALPSGRDDPGRQPAARADARAAGLLGRRRALAERLRRRRRRRRSLAE